MANVPTYPGVYIEEVSSGVHTIVGVQTSITAFVGPTRYGPIDAALVVHSFADFERKYGGLSLNSPLSFAVRDFFLNGGSTAVIARVYKSGATDGRAVFKLSDKVKLQAVDPGEWGNDIQITVLNQPSDKTFTLMVRLVRGKDILYTVVHRGVSLDLGAARPLDRVLEKESDMLRVLGGDLPKDAAPPPDIEKPEAPEVPGADSEPLAAVDLIGSAAGPVKTGINLLDTTDLFNILCIPPLTLDGSLKKEVIDAAAKYCEQRRAMLVIDPPDTWTDKDKAKAGASDFSNLSKNAAIYFPRVLQPNPLKGGKLETFVPCGIVAGVMARTDAERGVWKAPAGSEASLAGVQGLAFNLTDMENGELNPLGVNCLRSFPDRGRVLWGARTTVGNDALASEWKYVPIRRLALFLEETLFRSTSWIVFEPNDEPLWAQIRLNVGAFMHGMFVKGAFQGSNPRDAYFVKCDADTTPQDDRDAGIVNIRVGFAPLKPAEFVVISFQQIAGQIAV